MSPDPPISVPSTSTSATGGPRSQQSPMAGRWVEAGAVLVAAALLFLSELQVGERLLPRLGGGPVVWASTVVMFQLLLVVAYATGMGAGARRTRALGLLLLTSALLGLSWDWAPRSGARALLVPEAVGPGLLLIAFAAATVLPLVLGGRGPDQASGVRRLVALSNAGAFLGLVTGVFLQQHTDLSSRATLLRSVAALLGVLLLVLARASRRIPEAKERSAGAAAPSTSSPADAAGLLAAAAVGVLWYVGVHAYLEATTLVTPVLWAVTLGTYLATWVLAFALPVGRRGLEIAVASTVAGLVLALMTVLDAARGGAAVERGMAGAVATIGAGCLAAHLVARARFLAIAPAARASLWTAVGGAAGGLTALLVGPLLSTTPEQMGASALALAAVVGICSAERTASLRWGVAAAGGALSVAILLAPTRAEREGEVLRVERSWLGEFSVVAYDQNLPRFSHRVLFSSGTVHGAQYTDSDFADLPTAYYSIFTGVGRGLRAVEALRPPGRSLRFGIVGLGTGALATYAAAGDTLRFLELDPVVIELARPDGGDVGFSYLEQCEAVVEVEQGDGRALLASEEARADPRYDVLVLDAFTGGNVPAHLLTLEAFELYASRLARTGLLAVHTSNHVLDLRPPVYAGAAHVGARALFIRNRAREHPEGVGGTPHISMHADWILIWWEEGLGRAIEREIQPLVASGELLVQRGERVAFGVRAPLTDERLGVWHLRQGHVGEGRGSEEKGEAVSRSSSRALLGDHAR